MGLIDNIRKAFSRGLTCEYCDKPFATGCDVDFAIHVEQHHLNTGQVRDSETPRCDQCDKQIQSKDMADLGVIRYGRPLCIMCFQKVQDAGEPRADADPSNTCPDCHLTFDQKKNLKGHYIHGVCPRTAEAAPIFAADLRDLLTELDDDDDHQD